MFTGLTVNEKVQKVIELILGEPWGDGYIVTDIAHDYVEPGYRLESEDGIVVFGDWNPKRWPPLTKAESLPARLGDFLVHLGANIEWLDEWETCAGCQRAVRTQADSYSWTQYGSWVEDYGYLCGECLHEDMEESIADYVNNTRNAITWADGSALEKIGFVRWEPGNEHRYETGWYPGQEDDPEKVYEEILRNHDEDVDVVFLIDRVGQFDMHWGAYVRSSDSWLTTE